MPSRSLHGSSPPDILYYLDKAICQQAAPAFPGWPEAAAERGREAAVNRGRDGWNPRYGLSLSRDSVRDLARQCRHHGKIPTELRQGIQALLGYAAQDT